MNNSASKNLASKRLLRLRESLKHSPSPSQSRNEQRHILRRSDDIKKPVENHEERQISDFQNSESFRLETMNVPGDSKFDSKGSPSKYSRISKIIYYSDPRQEIPEKSEFQSRSLKRKSSPIRDEDDEERPSKIRCDRTENEFCKPKQQLTSAFVGCTFTTPDTVKNKSKLHGVSHSAPGRITCGKSFAQDRLNHLRKQINLAEESKPVLFQNKDSHAQSTFYPKKESNNKSMKTETVTSSKQSQSQHTDTCRLPKECTESNLPPNVLANVSQEVQSHNLFNEHLNFNTDVINIHQNNESMPQTQEVNNDAIEYMDQDESDYAEVLPNESSADLNYENHFDESKISLPATDTDSAKKAKSKETCIVVDTNIFLSNLRILKEIIDKTYSGKQEVVIYVPWMVMTELDYMKDSSKSASNLRKSANKAIAFINTCLESENKRLKGQTVYEMNKQIDIGKSPDDKILCSCIQATEEYETVILLSSDVNLKNKALMNNISVASPSEIQLSLHRLCKVSKYVQKITQKLNLLCSYVICECAKEAYGKAWNKMDLLKSGPWSLKDCIKIFKKYWFSVFKEKFLKQFEKALDDLMLFLEQSKSIDDKSKEFEDFVNLSCAVCIFIKDLDFATGMAVKTLSDIRNIKNSDL